MEDSPGWASPFEAFHEAQLLNVSSDDLAMRNAVQSPQ